MRRNSWNAIWNAVIQLLPQWHGNYVTIFGICSYWSKEKKRKKENLVQVIQLFSYAMCVCVGGGKISYYQLFSWDACLTYAEICHTVWHFCPVGTSRRLVVDRHCQSVDWWMGPSSGFVYRAGCTFSDGTKIFMHRICAQQANKFRAMPWRISALENDPPPYPQKNIRIKQISTVSSAGLSL